MRKKIKDEKEKSKHFIREVTRGKNEGKWI